MTKPELKLLERAFEAEIREALFGGLPIMQTKSKLAAKLVEDGALREVSGELPGQPPLHFSGFVLTERGRLIYCQSVK